MKQTLEYVLKQIVTHPDDILVEEQSEESRQILVVHANDEDYGKIIGKNGRIIRALRDLIKLMAARQGTYVDILLQENSRPADTHVVTAT